MALRMRLGDDVPDPAVARRISEIVDRAAAGERFDGVVPLGLYPAGVHGEAVVVTDERRVLDDVAVERENGREAVDLELGQSAR